MVEHSTPMGHLQEVEKVAHHWGGVRGQESRGTWTRAYLILSLLSVLYIEQCFASQKEEKG